MIVKKEQKNKKKCQAMKIGWRYLYLARFYWLGVFLATAVSSFPVAPIVVQLVVVSCSATSPEVGDVSPAIAAAAAAVIAASAAASASASAFFCFSMSLISQKQFNVC